MKKHIPNFITCLNLFSGCVGVYLAFQGNFQGAFIAVIVSAVFDFFDGFAARLLKAYSPMGKELDSLADVVSFGVLPGAMVFSLLSKTSINEWLPYVAFIIPVFSGLRLAKFNIDTRQTESFIGLPTPANALFIMSIPMIEYTGTYEWLVEALYNPFVLLGIAILSAYMLNAEIPLFSLKVKNISWATNKIQVFFLGISLVFLFFLSFTALPVIILFYVLLSVVNNKFLAAK